MYGVKGQLEESLIVMRKNLNILLFIMKFDKIFKINLFFQGFPNKYDEEISEHSQRFAPLGFYTSRDGKIQLKNEIYNNFRFA